MPLHRHARTLGAVGLITAGACGLLGTTAAHASISPGYLSFFANSAVVGVTGPGRDIPIEVGISPLPSTTTFTNVTVSIDTSGLAGVATATTTQSGCTTSGAKITCDLGTMSENNPSLYMMLHVTSDPGAKSGASGQFAFSGWADGVAKTTQQPSPTVTLADGPELGFPDTVGDSDGLPIANLTLGQIYTTPRLTFENFGSQNAEGVTIVYYTPYEAPFVNLASNCQYATYTDGGTYAACYFPNVIQPGQSDVITSPQQLQIRNDTIAGFEQFVQVFAEPGYQPGSAVDGSLTWSSGTGPALAIQPVKGTQSTTATKVAQTDIDPRGEETDQLFQVTNGTTADLAAIGATVNASAGSTATVTVGVRNNGPGTIDFGPTKPAAAYAIFTAPSGTTVTSAPTGCQAVTAGVKYICAQDPGAQLKAGASWTYTFSLAVSAAGAHSDGTVTVVRAWADGVVPSGPDYFDSDWSNDTARVVVNGGPATAPLVALTSNKTSVWEWTGSGTEWTEIGSAASNVYAGAAGVFATSPSNGAIFQYNGTPDSWTQIGRAGAQFVEGGGHLYALASNKSGVWEWTGNGSTWTQIGGDAATLYAGNDGLFATSPTNGDVFQYSGTGTSWSQVSGPAASVAVSGASTFALSTDKSTVTQMAVDKVVIGGAASSIYAGGLGLFATTPSTGDLYECIGTTFFANNSWVKIGGPGSSFSVGDSALYALTTSKNGVWKWSGSGTTWTRIGGPAAQIAAGD